MAPDDEDGCDLSLGPNTSDAMKPRVYIETSVISYLASRPTKDRVLMGNMIETRRWWDSSRPSFDAFTSELVREEASAGDVRAAAKRLKILDQLFLLEIRPQADALALSLLAAMALPPKARRDALHVGIAATNGIEYLLTWNCRHLANAMLRTKIETVCRQHGFEPPVICTPLELHEVQP
jgi:predicted nucleic acid-binding protein